MADATRTVDIIFKGNDQLSPAVTKIEAGLDGIGNEASDSEGKVEKLNTQVEGLGGRPVKAVDAATAALKALAASLIVKDFIDANVAFESFERTMTLVKGSSQAASEEFDYLKTLTNTLGLEVLTTAKNYADLSAATRGTTLEGQGTREIFEAVSIAMSALGKSSADTGGALTAITQIVSKGTVSMEELRQQLGERVPGAFQIAADSMGITTQELDKLVASGKLAAEDFLPKFAAGIKEAFGDVALVDTYTASLNRLKNAVTDAELQIGNAGAFDALKKLIEGGTLAVVGSISAFEVFGKVIGTVAAAVTSLDFSNLGESIDGILQDGANKTRDARDAFLGLADAAKVVTSSASDVLQPIEAQGAAIIYNLQQWEKYGQAIDETSVSLEKIASDERVAVFEAGVDLKIAQLEADAQKAVAIIESIGESASSTADLIGGLFGDLNEADNFNDRFRIEDQIDLENERRQELLDIQKRQAEAALRLDRLKADALRNGQALITVNGDGLQPHLEAIMYELLQAIQVRVNADGLDMLLGI